MKKKLSLLMVALVAITAFAMQMTAFSGESPYSYAFSTSAKTFTEDGTKDLGGVEWTLAVTWTTANKDYNKDTDGGMKIGSNNKSVTAMSLTSASDAFGTNYITSVKVTTAARSNALPALTVTVGGTEFKYVKDDEKLSSAPVGTDKTAVYEFVGVGQGAIVINWDGSESSSKGAIYVKQIDVAFQAEKPAGPAVAEPVFSLDGGTYAGAQSVEITCATDGASIFYTTDGTVPTAESTAYTGAISVSETTTIKAIGIKGEDKSEVATATYTIVEKIDGGSLNAPLTIAQAKALIDTKSSEALAHPDNKVYVKAIATVGEATVDNYGQLTYTLNDGNEIFDVYQGKTLDNAAFTADTKDDIDGKLVTVYGNIKKYKTSYEFDRGNYVVNIEEPVATKPIYFDPGVWTESDQIASYAAWAWVTGAEGAWYAYNSEEKAFTIPEDCGNIIFARYDPQIQLDQLTFDNIWNRTADIAIGKYNMFTITGWGADGSIYSTYKASNWPPVFYSVNIADGIQNGQVTAEPQTAEEGSTIKVTATPAEGFELSSITVTGVTINQAVPVAEDGTFVMPADDVTVSATFKEKAAPQPTVEKLYIIGNGTAAGWDNTTEVAFNEQTNAFEYEITAKEECYIAFGDAELNNDWDAFNGVHRYALDAAGNVVPTMGEAQQLVRGDGTACVLLAKGYKYALSVTKDLKLTVTRGEELPAQEFTATFSNTGNWENVYAYAWATTGEGNASQTREFLGSWPGTKLEQGINDLYQVLIKASVAPQFIVFNDGTLDGTRVGVNKTENLVFKDGEAYEFKPLQKFGVDFKTDKEWAVVYAYTYNPEVSGSWPGKKLEANNGIYTYGFEATEAPGFIIFNDGTTENPQVGDNKTIDYPFENGATYTVTTEQTTAWVGEKELAAEEALPVAASTLAYADVKAKNIISIKATEVAPSRGMSGNTTALAKTDITLLKADNSVLAEGEAIKVVEGGYEYEVADDATANELRTNGFKVKANVPLTISAIEVQEVAEPEDIVISPESGNIADALAKASEGKEVKDITINLTAGGAYTLGATLTAPNNITINGNGATVAVDDEFAGDFITLNGTTVVAKKADGVTDSDHKLIDAVTIANVNVVGLKGALVTDAQKTLVNQLTISGSVIQMPASSKNVLNFNSKGYVAEVFVKNSTIYANGNNTGFLAQYGSRPKNLWTKDGDADVPGIYTKQNFDVQNSTLVNIANGKNVTNLKQSGTAENGYVLKNNIFVDCGKSGQVVVGFNNGQISATPSWDVDGNVFNFNGADTSVADAEKAGKKNEEDIVKNSVKGVISFVDAAKGDFNAAFLPGEGQDQPATIPGDPRWTITAVKQLYIMGADHAWEDPEDTNKPAVTALSLKNSAFEYEFTSATANAYFAITDKGDAANWDELSGHRYGIGDGDQTITLDTPTDLAKYDNGTIVIAGAGKYKVSVSADMKVTVTKTGEIEHTYTVAGSFYYGDPVQEVKIFGDPSWDVTNTANDLEKQTDGTYKKVYENVVFEYAGNIEFKVAQDHAWDVNYGWPGSGHGDYNDNAFCEVTGTGTGTITIIFDPEGATDQDKVKIEVTGVPTGINGIDADAAGEKDVYYNLQGVRVANPGKGVYIKNGKKVLVK